MSVPKPGEVYFADDGTSSVVLEDAFDPTYDPPQAEVDEYARWLGIDVEQEKELMFVAKQGLTAPMPKEWKPCKTDTGDVYYFNFKTGESIWDHPMDEVFKKRVIDERAKLAVGGGVKKGKKESSIPKIEKGAAGATREEPAPVPGGKGLSTLSKKAIGREFARELKPKSLKLSALGADADDIKVERRPDTSFLANTKQDLAVNALLRKGRPTDLIKDATMEHEKKYREKYSLEFDTARKLLLQKQEKDLEELKNSLQKKLRTALEEQEKEREGEKEEAKRKSTRQTKRELDIYEKHIEGQKEELKRNLRELQQKLDMESAGLSRRVETEIREHQQKSDKVVVEQVAVQRQAIQEAWQLERSNAALKTQSKLRDLRSSHESFLAQERQTASQVHQTKVCQLEDALLKEVSTLRATIHLRRGQQLQALQDGRPEEGGKEYRDAVDQAHHVVTEARRQAQERCEAEERNVASQLREEHALFESQKLKIQQEAIRMQSGREESQIRRQGAAAKKVEDEGHKMQSEAAAFEQETEELVMRAKLVAEGGDTHQQAVEQRMKEDHQAAVASLTAAHQARLLSVNVSLIRASIVNSPEFSAQLQSLKSEWLHKNPEPMRSSRLHELGALPDLEVQKA